MSKPIINVTPLIDVLLVLLIIFMVVTPMKPTKFEARIPQEPKDDTPIKEHPDTLVVAINSDATLRLNKEKPVESPEQITSRLAEAFKARAEFEQ